MINFEQEYRRYKIAKVLNKKIDKEFESLYLTIKNNLSGLKRYGVISNDDMVSSYYFGDSEEECFVYYSLTTQNVMLEYNKIFKGFTNIINMKHIEGKKLVKKVLENNYGLEINNVQKIYSSNNNFFKNEMNHRKLFLIESNEL